MASFGVVREFSADDGWGVVDSEATPGGCFVHFSVIDRPGFATLDTGDEVTFEFETCAQDGFRFRATWVSTSEARSVRTPRPASEPGVAYSSTLTITDADGTVH